MACLLFHFITYLPRSFFQHQIRIYMLQSCNTFNLSPCAPAADTDKSLKVGKKWKSSTYLSAWSIIAVFYTEEIKIWFANSVSTCHLEDEAVACLQRLQRGVERQGVWESGLTECVTFRSTLSVKLWGGGGGSSMLIKDHLDKWSGWERHKNTSERLWSFINKFEDIS